MWYRSTVMKNPAVSSDPVNNINVVGITMKNAVRDGNVWVFRVTER